MLTLLVPRSLPWSVRGLGVPWHEDPLSGLGEPPHLSQSELRLCPWGRRACILLD